MTEILGLFTKIIESLKGLNLPLFGMNLYQFIGNALILYLLLSVILSGFFGINFSSKKKDK